MDQAPLSFVGAGNMGGAILRGLLARGYAAHNIALRDPDASRQEEWSSIAGLRILDEPLWDKAEVVLLAVKPQLLESVCRELRPLLPGRERLIISIAAGVPLAQLRDWLGEYPMVRAMPNLPALAGESISALWAPPTTAQDLRRRAEQLLAAVGVCVWLGAEEEFHAVTALSGSGPAYFFLLMEAMQEAAQQLGLEEALARRLILHTARGAAALAAQGEDSPAQWRRKVTSPGGTTEAALSVMDKDGVRRGQCRGVIAAARRSRELAGAKAAPARRD